MITMIRFHVCAADSKVVTEAAVKTICRYVRGRHAATHTKELVKKKKDPSTVAAKTRINN